jgi:hypothetical protein
LNAYRALSVVLVAVLCAIAYSCGGEGSPPASPLTPTSTTAAGPSPSSDPLPIPIPQPPPGPGPFVGVLIGAGDISTCRNDNDEATARLLDRHAGTIFTLGDNAYEDGTAREYGDCYAPTWGRHLGRTRPTPGNHEYRTPGASGYFGYFGGAAGPGTLGYYSYDMGGLHILSLNSYISASSGSTQYEWLRGDLAANKAATCSAAYWHHPVFSSGEHGNNSTMRAILRLLYENGVELILSGHDHEYERFALQNPDGQADPERGFREFVVGTGGKGLDPFPRIQPNSEVRDSSSYGVLKLTLREAGYDWEFVSAPAGAIRDSGSGVCR